MPCLPSVHSQNSYVSLSLPATLSTTLSINMVSNDVNEVWNNDCNKYQVSTTSVLRNID